MSEQTTPQQRRFFFTQHQAGQSYRQIATAANVSVMCVRYWCRRLARGQPAHSIYRRQPRGLLQSFPPIVRYVLLRLRLAHPQWGASRLRYHMSQRASLAAQRLPGCASIGYYLHQWERFRRPPHPPVHRADPTAPARVHEEWQVDYKMAIPTADGRLVNLVDIRDPVGAAVIGAFEHASGTPGHRSRYLTFPELRADLRQCFAHWQTLPERIQTDNEAVFIGKPENDFPSPFVLWLKGLGINHVAIRPGQPTDNAAVERQHRTLTNYCLCDGVSTTADLQAVLEQARAELNQALPSRAHGCHGQPPLSAHPDLLQPRRSFSARLELAQFDLRRVDAYLATFTWTRKVGKKGQVTLGGQNAKYTVGHKYAGQRVLIRFDAQERRLVFRDGAGAELRQRPLNGLTTADLTGLAAWPDGLGVQQMPLPLDVAAG